MKQVFIYVLIDPNTREVRYVGKTIWPTKRIFGHLKDSKNSHKKNWVAALLSGNQKPIFEIVDMAGEHNWESVEKSYITAFRALGCKLTNLAEGGNGPHGVCRTEETRRLLGFQKLGTRNPRFGKPGTLLGKHPSLVTRKKMSQSHLGLQVGEKNGMFGKPGSNLGRKFSPDWCAKISAAKKLHYEKKRQEAILAEMWR